MAYQITRVSTVCSTVCSGTDQRKHQSSASLAFVRWIHWWLVDSPPKGPVTRKELPFDDVIMDKASVWFNYTGATARSYRRQDGADAAARFDKFLPARASLRPPISLKFTTKKHGGMVHLSPKWQTHICSRFCTMIPERFAARRR